MDPLVLKFQIAWLCTCVVEQGKTITSGVSHASPIVLSQSGIAVAYFSRASWFSFKSREG